MFTKKKSESDGLQKVIDQTLTRMSEIPCDGPEYAKLLEQLIKLYKLKEIKFPKPISADTLLVVAGNLVGIVLILGYEKVNVVTSRAIGFVMKAR